MEDDSQVAEFTPSAGLCQKSAGDLHGTRRYSLDIVYQFNYMGGRFRNDKRGETICLICGCNYYYNNTATSWGVSGNGSFTQWKG